MCGFLGKISKDPFSTDKFELANEHNICRGPDAIKKIEGQFSELEYFESTSFYSFIFNRFFR